MAAVYPNTVKSFTTKTDFTDLILAEHVNTLQDEVRTLEATIGTNPATPTNFVGTFSKTTSVYSTLKDRIANLEYGVVGDVHTQYIHNTGGDTIQPTNATGVALTLQGFTSQTADLLQFKDSLGTIVSRVGADGSVTAQGQKLKPILYQSAQPDGVALGLPAGTVWVASNSNPPTLAADTTIQNTGGSLIGDQALDSRLRNITISTSDPSGGNNGDIWIKYTA
jgi:hypothetical protein